MLTPVEAAAAVPVIAVDPLAILTKAEQVVVAVLPTPGKAVVGGCTTPVAHTSAP